MTDNQVSKLIDWLVISMFLLFIGGVLYMWGLFGVTKQVCLSNGYPDFQVTWNIEQYCIKRVDQTDVVIPLKVLITPVEPVE